MVTKDTIMWCNISKNMLYDTHVLYEAYRKSNE